MLSQPETSSVNSGHQRPRQLKTEWDGSPPPQQNNTTAVSSKNQSCNISVKCPKAIQQWGNIYLRRVFETWPVAPPTSCAVKVLLQMGRPGNPHPQSSQQRAVASSHEQQATSASHPPAQLLVYSRQEGQRNQGALHPPSPHPHNRGSTPGPPTREHCSTSVCSRDRGPTLARANREDLGLRSPRCIHVEQGASLHQSQCCPSHRLQSRGSEGLS